MNAVIDYGCRTVCLESSGVFGSTLRYSRRTEHSNHRTVRALLRAVLVVCMFCKHQAHKPVQICIWNYRHSVRLRRNTPFAPCRTLNHLPIMGSLAGRTTSIRQVSRGARVGRAPCGMNRIAAPFVRQHCRASQGRGAGGGQSGTSLV